MINPLLPLGMAMFRRGRALIVFCVAFWASAASAETAYVAEAIPLTTGPGDGAPLGSVEAAAVVDVSETRDAWQHVVLRGWAREGAERVLFAIPGKRILVAAVRPEAVDGLRAIGSQTDPETQIVWLHLEIDGWIAASATRPDIEPIWSEAWGLFATRCTACHVRRVPSNYTANQWRSHLKVMGPRTGLPKAQQGLILAFLQHHASDTIEAEIAAGTAFPRAIGR